MKHLQTLGLLGAVTVFFVSFCALAGGGEIEAQENHLKNAMLRADYVDRLKTRYSLTDSEIMRLRGKGFNTAEITIVAQLAESSATTLEEVARMRGEQKLSWGQIAKRLGVRALAISHLISYMRR